MRIVHYIKWLRQRDGGVVRAAVDLASLLARAGDEVTILTADDADLAKLAPDPRVRVVRLRLHDPVAQLRGRNINDARGDTPTQMLDSASLKAARDCIAGADAVHLHGVWTTSTWQVARIARRARVPYVISAHGMLDDWCMAQGAAKKRLHLALVSGSGLRRARAVHCTAKAEAEQVARNVPGVTTRVVALPFDASPFLSSERSLARETLAQAFPSLAPSLRAGAPLVAFMSRIHVKKGVLPLIHAWEHVAADVAPGLAPVLAIAGPFDPPEYEPAIRGAISASKAADRIVLLGMVTGSTRAALLAGADLFALPTSQENFGYALLEALASGSPVLTTKGVDIWPELESSGACTLVEAHSESIARAITDLIRDRDTLAARGISGRAWATAYSDASGLVSAYRAMYFDR